MTGTDERTGTSTREIPLARGGRVEVLTTARTLRIRGHDADLVRISVPDGDDLDRSVAIDEEGGRVRVREAVSMMFRLGPLMLGASGGASGQAPDLDLVVPRTATLSVRTISGDVEASGLAAETRWASASGALRLRLEGGSVAIESMSGNVDLGSSEPLAVTVRTVSGRVRLRAPIVLGLAASTTSGNVAVEAGLDVAGVHEITTVSGDVELATDSDVRLDTRSVTGDVDASVAHRSEGTRGRRTIVVGTGAVAIGVRTMSGHVQLRHGSGSPAVVPPEPPAVVPPEPPAAPAPPVAPPAGDDAAPPPLPPVEPPFVVAEAEAAPNLVRATAPLAGGESDVDRRETARLEVLRALERGELDIDAASGRLEALEEAGPRYFRGWV